MFIELPVQTKMVPDVGSRISSLIGKLLVAESECAAYREALKNVMRSKPEEGAKIAKKALFGKAEIRQRGRSMLKIVKAAVIATDRLRNGNDEDFAKAVASLEVWVDKFDLKGVTVKKWLKEARNDGT